MLPVPVPGGNRSAGAAGARLCAGWLGEPELAELLVCLQRPSLPSSSEPLRRCCCVVSLPVPPPATQGSPVLFPPSCCGCGLHAARSLLPLPHSKEHPDPSRPKARGQELRFHPLVLPGKGLARAGGPLASQQGAPGVFGAQIAGDELWDEPRAVGWVPAPAPQAQQAVVHCSSPACPCQLPEVESFWEDLRGPRVT